MAQSFRQPQILDIARSEGRVVVDDLAARLGVTVQTIRKDLSDLADAGKLDRVHGGAVLPSGTINIAYEQRRVLQGAAKTAIARACAADIPDAASVFLNIGTTTEAVARELIHHHNLMVVTNNMNVANILLANPDCEIILAGGRVRRSDGGLVGNVTVSIIERFKVDYAVIG
jgi:DeoR family glycerol-3-phosphate regulon repressor